MLFLTRTPLGRDGQRLPRQSSSARSSWATTRACVRFLQFALSGFFAGIGGGLYALTYEIVTFDAVAAHRCRPTRC